jgi:hypothetical protein
MRIRVAMNKPKIEFFNILSFKINLSMNIKMLAIETNPRKTTYLTGTLIECRPGICWKKYE